MVLFNTLIHMLVLKLFCLLAAQSLKQHSHGSIPFNFLFENLYMPLRFCLFFVLSAENRMVAESRQRLVEFVDLRIKRLNSKEKFEKKKKNLKESSSYPIKQRLWRVRLWTRKKGVEHTIRLCHLWLSSREKQVVIQLASFVQ